MDNRACPVCGMSATLDKSLFNKPMASCNNKECWMFGLRFDVENWNKPRPLEESLLLHITDCNKDVKKIALNVIAFASQLEAWGHAAAAQEILVEILGGKVNAPDYYKLKEENTGLRTALQLADDSLFELIRYDLSGEDFQKAVKAREALARYKEKTNE